MQGGASLPAWLRRSPAMKHLIATNPAFRLPKRKCQQYRMSISRTRTSMSRQSGSDSTEVPSTLPLQACTMTAILEDLEHPRRCLLSHHFVQLLHFPPIVQQREHRADLQSHDTFTADETVLHRTRLTPLGVTRSVEVRLWKCPVPAMAHADDRQHDMSEISVVSQGRKAQLQ